MKINSVVIAMSTVLAGFTSAQNGLPTCAQSCVTQYTTGSQIAGCASLDIACICSNSSFLNGIACCLADACDTEDEQTAVTYAQNLCRTSGVTNLPSVVSCASSASSTSSSAASSATGAAGTTTSGSSTASRTGTSSSNTATGSSTSASASATSNAGLQNEIGAGAGLLGGLAVIVGLL
ncbi:hypothetical protein BOTCAL_0026g00160 [Botryotinia calthae]|uniref:CFEM domain-containing protein n=1 Tax=Botryotinia calthae TaxID=38488 RepID=A0A4Y8DGP1_9HELO|nr:hypothetical protein BOTCAL_0026g00160 [Botryotinia calthae]